MLIDMEEKIMKNFTSELDAVMAELESVKQRERTLHMTIDGNEDDKNVDDDLLSLEGSKNEER